MLQLNTISNCWIQTSIAVNHTRNTSSFKLSVQQCLISFETVAHSRELELHFFNKCLNNECVCFICGNCWDLYTLWLSVLNKNQSSKLLKPHSYLHSTCVLIITCFRLIHFENIFHIELNLKLNNFKLNLKLNIFFFIFSLSF